MDRYISDEEILTLPQGAQDFIVKYYFRSLITGQYLIMPDDDRFTNHSLDPNVGGPDSLNPQREGGVALRDIEAGEEITNNYASIDADFGVYQHEYASD